MAKAAAYPLRLEWIEAGSLAQNPLNWRRHPDHQVRAIKDLIGDPEVGWAGACLYNERTKRLVDGHARRSAVDPKTLVPVLVGSWSEEAEKKILATLDPLAAAAQTDTAAYRALVEQVETDSVWLRDLMLEVERYSQNTVDGEEEAEAEGAVVPEMECKPFEHHDYIVLLFRDAQDFQGACERLAIGKATFSVRGGKSKIGMVRVIDGPKAIEALVAGKPATAGPAADPAGQAGETGPVGDAGGSG